ncbi:molybdopterin-dependent oxidoreductase [Xenophilus arseniciresistens]|uniref:Molybdopterin-dependent oxidoreductase n=1 Tax=Xenophilus arseniciresistens TaxID=1283306 RepID=A0AAE3N704_9BURK|nr:molybdopterin-dependent oxidoreductase [Xenophilus arseniciresistens]MDA7416058.1 molybdopterin-dependent oxidoreductase [Xenophilus arseniciresistens]
MRQRELTAAHWGVYEVDRDAQGRARGLRSLPEDPDPSPIGLSMWAAYQDALRVQWPAVRRSWLHEGPGARPELRGREAFVRVPWTRALELVAHELERVRSTHGNEAIFGGSYGWSSAGRFHHAQSQVHRFLNALGGYVRSVDSYSLGAARVLMPHIVAPMEELMASHHGWDVMQANTRLLVAFGGIPAKNSQVTAGGAAEHRVRSGLAALAAAGCRLVNFSPVRDNFDAPEGTVQWIPIRPNTDTAVMMALACEIVRAGRHDSAFLASHCVGFERWATELEGRHDGTRKDADWAEAISGVPAQTIRALAHDLCSVRSLVNVSWSLQRAEHGEQPFWAAVALACVIGQVGLPGGGFGVGYGAANILGSPHTRFSGPTLPQGSNPVKSFIPVARIADMLLDPGGSFAYNGAQHRYPDIRLIYWAGGNPFHHHQDLNRLARAWRKPETIIAHEQVWNAHAKMADIVLPATSTLERDDIGFATREPLMVAMKAIAAAPGEAMNDYDIFAALAKRLGATERFTEGRDAGAWLRHLYAESRERAKGAGVDLPDFDDFWQQGEFRLPPASRPVVMLEDFRADPLAHPLRTPSGRIEIHSGRIASFGLADCPGHPVWRAPREWLGAAKAAGHPLHLISDQPHTKLHSQLDFSTYSRANKVALREPVVMHSQDARARGIRDADMVRVFNERGACLAGARVDDSTMPGVVRIATGAWWDPTCVGEPGSMDRHGNPNVLTQDVGASGLSQGCSAQSCLVQVERWTGELPELRAFALPEFETKNGSGLADLTR